MYKSLPTTYCTTYCCPAKQRHRNVQQKCAARAKLCFLFLVIRAIQNSFESFKTNCVETSSAPTGRLSLHFGFGDSCIFTSLHFNHSFFYCYIFLKKTKAEATCIQRLPLIYDYFLIRCFDSVSRRPYQQFSITFLKKIKVLLSLSFRFKMTMN